MINILPMGHPFPDYWGNWVNTDCGEWELNYDGGTTLFSEKATLTGDSSGATGVIKWFSGDASFRDPHHKGTLGYFSG